MPKRSAAILMWKREDGRLCVLLVHPGGPFWCNKDLGAWSLPKGEYDDSEDALAAARRELAEELGPSVGWVTTRGILHNHARDWSVASSVKEAITESPASVTPSATLADAVNAFVATGASHVLVAASGDAVPVGVIADSDLVTFMAR